MTPAIRKALSQIANAYGCQLREVEFAFSQDDERGEDSYLFRISTPHRGRQKRRAYNEVTSVSGDTLAEALANALRYARYHGRDDL